MGWGADGLVLATNTEKADAFTLTPLCLKSTQK